MFVFFLNVCCISMLYNLYFPNKNIKFSKPLVANPKKNVGDECKSCLVLLIFLKSELKIER